MAAILSFVFGTFILVIGAAAASQSDRDDCQWGDPAELRIAACTRVVADASASRVNLADAFFGRATAYHYLTHDYERAIADYDQAIQLSPNNPVMYLNRGQAHSDRRDYDLAVADFSQVIVLAPGGDYAYGAHSARAEIYRQKGDYDRAIADYRSLLSIPSDNPQGDVHAKLTSLEQERTAVAERAHAASQSPDEQSPPAPVAALGIRVALVVGNSAYEKVPRLSNPTRDATAVAAAFRRLGFGTVILLEDLSKQDMEQALIDFAERAQGADWAVVYFAGHGIEMDGQNYLIPVDAALKLDRHVRLETILLDDVLDAAGGALELRLIILDACRDNPFAAQMTRTVATRSIGRGLARVEPAAGDFVAFAARHGQVAIDGDGDHSPFVAALLDHINEPGLDLRLMFDKVRDSVMAVTNDAQQPFTYGSLPAIALSFRPVE